MHGKLVIRYYCLYRNQLLSWTNPIPFVSIDHIIFHGPSRGWTYSELNPMCTSTSIKVQPDWTKITPNQHQQHSSNIKVNKKQIKQYYSYFTSKAILKTETIMQI